MASFALLLVALLVLVISWLWDYVILCLIWKPHIIGNKLRKHGIPGPPYKFFKGCNEDIKRMKEKADSLVLDIHDHNYLPRVAPHYLKWRDQYGIGSSQLYVLILGLVWVVMLFYMKIFKCHMSLQIRPPNKYIRTTTLVSSKFCSPNRTNTLQLGKNQMHQWLSCIFYICIE